VEVRRVKRSRTENEGGPSDRQTMQSLATGHMARSLYMAASLAAEARTKHVSDAYSVETATVPLMRADEIARYFARETGLQLLLVKGQKPMAIARVNRDEDERFATLLPDTATLWRTRAAALAAFLRDLERGRVSMQAGK